MTLEKSRISAPVSAISCREDKGVNGLSFWAPPAIVAVKSSDKSETLDLGDLMKIQNPMLVSAPIVSLIATMCAVYVGATWWVVISTFFLTAPAMIGLATLLCNTVLPCDRESRSNSGK